MTFDEIIAAFETSDEVPTAALKAASEHADALSGCVYGLIDKLVGGVYLLPRQSMVLLYGLPVLAAAGHAGLYTHVMQLLELPEEDLEEIFPGYVSVTLTRLILSCWDGDADRLFRLIEYADIGEEARCSLFQALAYLTFDGRIERSQTIQFLERFERDKIAGSDDFTWLGWEAAVILIGADTLEPALKRVWTSEVYSAHSETDHQEALERLSQAKANPRDAALFKEAGFVPIGDAAEACEWIDKRRVAVAEIVTGKARELGLTQYEPTPSAEAAEQRGGTEDEVHWLGGFLASRQTPETAMSLEMLDGYLTALALGPQRIAPSRYLPLIWGNEANVEPKWDSEEQAHFFSTALGKMFAEIIAIAEADEPIEPMLEERFPHEIAADWAQGFEEGVLLCEEAWSPIWQSERGKDLMWSVLSLADANSPEDGLEDELSDTERETLVRRLPENVRLISRFWRQGEKALRREPVRVEKVGRNDPCPCGSGKKYKKCCGSATPATLH